MMKKMLTLMALTLTVASAPLLAADATPDGIGNPDYVWNKMEGEKLEALKAKGDALRGEIAFEICQGCHRAGALGREDGSYPRLAGQHASVLIKQMTDVRAGRRPNPKMLPFANHDALSVQDIADISVYLRSLPSPANNGKGDGKALDKGKKFYEDDCATCHGDNGEGDGPKFYPRVSGQHYQYLLREAALIRDGQRPNANPMMVKAIKQYSNQDLEAVSDYISRFPSK
jgi:cytochrome c553